MTILKVTITFIRTFTVYYWILNLGTHNKLNYAAGWLVIISMVG